MRLLSLTRGDVRFQWKYGFYFVYAVFTALYALVLYAVPDSARRAVATVLIYTDPAAMGLFFMGAIVLLEKSQGVNCALAVAPIRVWEYCAAKVLSLAVVGLLVGLILAEIGGVPDPASAAVGILLASALCSLCGLIVAMSVTTLNQFLIYTIPFELFLCLPPALLLFGFDRPALLLHPGVAAVSLIFGDAGHPALCLLVLAVWGVLAFFLCLRTVRRNFVTMGGAAI